MLPDWIVRHAIILAGAYGGMFFAIGVQTSLRLMVKAIYGAEAMADEIVVNEMPTVLRELTTFVNRWPAMDCWRRARFAVTQAEIDAMRDYFRHDGSHQFAWAVRGVALQIEDYPENAAIIVEPFRLAAPE